MPLPPVGGTLVKDIDPGTWGLTNGTALTFANSGLTPQGVTNPLFRTPVFDTGAPAAQCVFGTSGFSITRPVQDDFTLYAVIKDPLTTALGAQFWNNGSLIDCEAPFVSNDFGINFRSDGHLSGGVGNPDTTVTGTHLVNTGTHIISVTRQKVTGLFQVYVDGVLDLSLTNNTNSLSAQANLYFGVGPSQGDCGVYYGRFLAYDAVHSSTDLGTMYSYLLGLYGESAVLRTTKAVTYVPIGPPLLESCTKAVMYVITGPDNGARQRMKVRLVRGHH
jgi:hypothetical protein